MHAADAEIVFYHVEFYDVLTSTRITHGTQGVENELGIEGQGSWELKVES